MNGTMNAQNKDYRKAEVIRKQYISRDEDSLLQLQKLDSKVKLPGRILAGAVGTLGAIVMGAGMSLVMVWENMTKGLALSIPGLIVLLLAYPLYALITNNRKKKYAQEIIRLSEKMMS